MVYVLFGRVVDLKRVKETIDRCHTGMPIILETIPENREYRMKITIAGETEYLTYAESRQLFRALFLCIGEIEEVA